MNKKKKRKRAASGGRSQPYYSLKTIFKCIKDGRVRLEPKVLHTAYRDFGWGTEKILDALKKLRRRHYYKTEPLRTNASTRIHVDYYRAKGLKGENVYTHFHIDDDHLVIGSFKEDKKNEVF